MKEKDYTITIDVHVTKDDKPKSKRWYALTITGHPIIESAETISFELSNMREEQTLKVGKKVLEAIWNLVETKDSEFWQD